MTYSKSRPRPTCRWTCSCSQDSISFGIFSLSKWTLWSPPQNQTYEPHVWVWHGQSVWEDNTNSRGCWSTSHQRVSVPDESDWIILSWKMSEEHLRVRMRRAWTHLATFNSRNQDENKWNKTNWGSLPFMWPQVTPVNQLKLISSQNFECLVTFLPISIWRADTDPHKYYPRGSSDVNQHTQTAATSVFMSYGLSASAAKLL